MTTLTWGHDHLRALPRHFWLLAGGVGLALVALIEPLAALAILGVIVVIAGALFLEIGFGIYVFCLHFILLVRRFLMNMPIGLVLDGALILMLIGLIIRLSRGDCPERRRWQHPLVAAVLLLKSYMVINSFNPNSLNWLFGIYAIKQTIPDLAIFMLTVFLVNTRQRLYGFLTIWFGLLLIVGAYGVYQQVVGFHWREVVWMWSPDGMIWRTAEGVLRVFSTLTPDTLGISMAYAITLAVALLLAPIPAPAKLALLLMLPVFGGALLYSGTRSAYAAALAGVFGVVFLLGRWWLYIVAPLAGLIAAVSIDWTSDYWGRRFLSLFNPERDSSFQVRNNIIGQHLNEALNKPFGNGTATTSYADFARESLNEARQRGELLATGINVPTDNNYFLALLEGGVVGALLLIVVVFVVMAYALRIAFVVQDRTLRCVAVGLCGCVGSTCLASLSNNYLQFWGAWLLIALVVGVDLLAREEAAARLTAEQATEARHQFDVNSPEPGAPDRPRRRLNRLGGPAR